MILTLDQLESSIVKDKLEYFYIVISIRKTIEKNIYISISSYVYARANNYQAEYLCAKYAQ